MIAIAGMIQRAGVNIEGVAMTMVASSEVGHDTAAEIAPNGIVTNASAGGITIRARFMSRPIMITTATV